MPLLTVYVIYWLEDGRFWDSLEADWISLEQARERARQGRVVRRLVNASGPADELALMAALLFYGYSLGGLAESLPPNLGENLERNATIRDIEEVLAPLRSSMRDLREKELCDLAASLENVEGELIPGLSARLASLDESLASVDAALPGLEERLGGISASLPQIQDRLDALDAALPELRGDVMGLSASLPALRADLLGLQASVSAMNSALDGKAGTAQASQTAAGLMSAADKKKLDGIAAGAQVNPSLAPYATTSAMNTALAGYLPLAGGSLTGLLNLQNAFLKIVSTGTDYYYVVIKNPAIVKNTAPASQINVQNAWSIRDKNEQPVAISRVYDSSSGVFRLSWLIYAHNVDAQLHLEIAADGTKTLHLPANPPAASNTTHAASTSWTRARISAATGKGATTFSLNPEIATLALDDFCEWRPDMVTGDMLEAARKVINDYSAQAIFYGFWHELKGENYFFTYDLYDQQNFSDNAILALSGEDVSLIARNECGEMVKVAFTSGEMTALHKHAVKTHKQAFVDLALERKNEIIGMVSESGLKAKLNEYGLLENYEEYMAAASAGHEAGIEDSRCPVVPSG